MYRACLCLKKNIIERINNPKIADVAKGNANQINMEE
jgi:hypothetical protein